MLNQLIGQYRIMRRLGQGGMGEIFAALDEKLNRTVAVKFIASSRLDSETSRRMFLGEARAAAALDHPFICMVHDVLEHDGQPMIVMECVEGETLQSRIERGALPADEVVRHSLEIAEALGAAHARGIVHRDVKSANIMITPNGHLKVMDFGLAIFVTATPHERTAHLSEEVSSKMAGTLPYMAPETLRGEAVAASADLYALGVVMYEMLTGRRPFNGKTDAILVSEILERAPVSPRQLNPPVPVALSDLVVQLLSKTPAKRPAVDDVMARLRAVGAPKRGKSQSLAILPFRSLTPDAESAHLGLALADATTSELALVQSLIVRPSAAILGYQNTDPLTAAQELGVDAVVAGTYQRAGSRLRVNVQLISAIEQRPLWSTKIDSTLDDIFAMQDEVSRKIVAALELELTSADERRFSRRQQAYGDVLELYVKGRVALLHETVPELNKAIEYFERALSIEPDNALLLIAVADAYCRLAFTWDPEGGWYERAKETSDRALQLDPDIPEGHYIRARLAWTPQAGFQHEYAIREIVAGLAERPNFNEGFDWLATVLFHVGLVEESQANYRKALAISPDDELARTHLLMGDLLRGNYTQSSTLASARSSWETYMAVSAQLRLGDLAAAGKTIEEARRTFPENVLFHSARAVLAAIQNDEPAANVAIERTLQNRRAYGHFHHAEMDLAAALAIIGRGDEAMEHLESAVRNGYPCLAAVENDPLLESLRSHSRYGALIEDLRAQREQYRGVYEEVRRTITT